MNLDELRALRKLLKVCGIAPEGRDAADMAPSRVRDLERITSYVEALQTNVPMMAAQGVAVAVAVAAHPREQIEIEKGRVLDRLNETRVGIPSSQWNTYCPVCGQGPFKHACGTSCEGGKCTVLNHCKPKCTCGLPDNEPCKVHGDKIYKEEDPCTCLEQPGALCPRCHKGIGR